MIEESCDFIVGNSSLYGDHRHCDSGNIIILFCHMILQDHMSHVTLWVEISTDKLLSCKLPSNLVAIGIIVVEVLWFQFVT